MKLRLPLALLGVAAFLIPPPGARAQSASPTLVVNLFTAKKGIDWPYDFKQLQTELVARLKKKLGDKTTITAAAPGAAADASAYTVDGEVVRMYQQNNLDGHAGGLASNDEIITVQYWMTGPGGKKIFTKSSTYTEPSTGSYSDADFGTPGPLAKDLESDVTSKVSGSKVF